MERELTYAAVYHPEFIGDEWQLVDHPTVRPLQNGDPTLGWEGDVRLAVYLFKPTKRFVLWRLEHDNEYRPVAQLPEDAELTFALINKLIRRLIEIDQRRGANPLDVVEGEMARRANDLARIRQDRISDFADKLHFGLAHSHLPGVDVTRPRQVSSRR